MSVTKLVAEAPKFEMKQTLHYIIVLLPFPP